MRFPVLLVCILQVLNEGKCKLDFSQFHLPPCCLTPSPATFSGYASRIGATLKREAPQQKVNQPVLKYNNFEYSEVRENGSMKVDHDNRASHHKTPNAKVKFYSVSIPIDDLENSKQLLNIVQKPPTIGRIFFPEGKFEVTDATDQSREYSATSTILEKIFNTELSKTDIKSKRIIRRKSTSTTSNLEREHRSGLRHQFPSKKLVDHYINWESKRITQPAATFTENDDRSTSNQVLQNSATEHQEQVVKRIPSSWVKYLKRALYQSITDGKGLIIDEGATTGTFHSRNNAQHQVVKSKIRFPDTWKSIKSAKLQYVDKMAQVSTTPYGEIYLPIQEGPVISGVLVNSHDGHLHLRVASELYFPEEQLHDQNCGCYLLSPGEILVAYWSVSRIFKDNGQPALQYLVYPLPHSVPTPPEFLPFSNSVMFHPSEMDPLNNFYENIQHSANYIDYPKNELPHPQHPLNYASKGHGHTMTRNPKPIQPFPNDELLLEHFNQQLGLGISPSPQPYTLPQSPAPQLIGEENQGVPQPPVGVNNAFLENVPSELLNPYQQFILQNAFNGQFPNGQNTPFHSIPYNNLLNVQGPIQYEQQTQLLPPSSPPPEPSISPLSQQEEITVNSQLPVSVNPTDLPPQQDGQLSRPLNAFPNSIQDIISPQELQQQPIRSEQMMPPSTVQQLSGGALVGTPTPTAVGIPMPYPFPLEQLPFLVNYPPHFPPAYMDINLQHEILQHQGRLHNQKQNQNSKQTEGHDETQKTKLKKVEHENKNREPNIHNQPPIMISNILDNEKKYYPIRIQNSAVANYAKHRYERQRRLRKRKLLNDINRKGGYVLDF